MGKSWAWVLAVLGMAASRALAIPSTTSQIVNNPDYDCQCGWVESLSPGAVWYVRQNKWGLWAKARVGTSLNENYRVWGFQVDGIFSNRYFDSSHPYLVGLAPEIKFVPTPGRLDLYLFGGLGAGFPAWFLYVPLGGGLEFFPDNADKFFNIFLEAGENFFLNSETGAFGPAFNLGVSYKL